MERRAFLLGMLGLGAGAATLSLGSTAQAAPTIGGAGSVGDLESLIENAQWGPPGRPGHRPGRRPPPPRSRVVCRTVRNRWGRPTRECRRVWF